MEGLFTIHEKKITHKDIKPANILFSEENLQIYIIDFGLAIAEKEFLGFKAECGTLAYMPPDKLERYNR